MKNHFIVRLLQGMAFVLCLLSINMASAADTIKTGVAEAHTGDLALYGLPTVKAAELVIRNINAQGNNRAKEII
jgi:branched-chain amino acid transport system substrate-binding protein